MIIQHTERGLAIELYLRDGTANGKIEASLLNWTGKLVRAERNNLQWLLEHENAQKPGVYLLQGRDPKSESETQQRIYIGQSDKIAERLRQQARDEDKGFWETACLITASDRFLYGTRCSYIEAKLIAKTREARRTTLHNKQKPSTNPPLPQSAKDSLDDFIEKMEIVLPILRFDFLKKLQPRSTEIKSFMFELRHKASGVRAIANELNGDFFVLKGSQSITEADKPSNTYFKKRQTLIEEKDLEKIGENSTYEFTKDVYFSSPSAAASIVLNRQASPREWKVNGTKMRKDYNDWLENPKAFASNFL